MDGPRILVALQLLFLIGAFVLLVSRLRASGRGSPIQAWLRYAIVAIAIASILVTVFSLATFGIAYIGMLAPMAVTLGFCGSALLIKRIRP